MTGFAKWVGGVAGWVAMAWVKTVAVFFMIWVTIYAIYECAHHPEWGDAIIEGVIVAARAYAWTAHAFAWVPTFVHFVP